MVFFRSRAFCGLGVASVSHFFNKMQMIKCSLLATSKDMDVQAVYHFKASKSSSWKVKWDARKVFKNFSADAHLQLKFPTQSSRLGLGHKIFCGAPSDKDIRELIVQTASRSEDEKLFASPIASSLSVRAVGQPGSSRVRHLTFPGRTLFMALVTGSYHLS